ncbi:tetratricopeptide repeat protein [Nocardia vinacea]|uniref:tetratricopeptide repeat protein n=1 Tax=Nocardia vinacea TaxID=96468 RepID=UPI003AF39E5E
MRTQHGWTAQQLADRCGDVLTRSTIAKIESGVRQAVTVEQLAVLARAFAVQEAELLTPPNATEELADALMALRRSARKSTRRLAADTKISPQTVTRIDAADRLPEWSIVERLVEALGGDVSEFNALWRRAKETQAPAPSLPSTGIDIAPQQLPPATRAFVGRHHELAMLDALLSGSASGPLVCVISGIGGVGKTALAVTWAHSARKRFPDGCLYVDLHGFDPNEPTSPVSALNLFLLGLGIPGAAIPTDVQAMSGLYRSIVANKRILVVLDNARDAQQVAPLLPAGDSCVTVVTSRQQLPSLAADYGATNVNLSVLPSDEAVALLVRRMAKEDIERESAEIQELAHLCAGLPLALNIVGAQAAMRLYPLTELVDRLRQADNRLDVLEVGDFNLRAALAASYQSLDSNSARLFRLLGLVPSTGFDRYDAAALCGAGMAEVTPLLERLLQASLIESSAPGRFHMHELLWLYAQDRVHAEESEQSRREALNRMLDYLLHTASLADSRLDSYWEPIALDPPTSGTISRTITDQADAVAWFAAELDNLLTAIRLAATHSFLKHAWQLAAVLTTFMYRQVRWHQWTDMLQIAADSARLLEDAAAEARINRILGTAYARLGRYEQAREVHERALATFRTLGDTSGQANTLLMLCRLFNWQGLHEKALECADEALRLYEQTNHPGQARAMIDLGRSNAFLQRYDEATDLAERALVQCREGSDLDGECTALALLGDVHYQVGDFTGAAEAYNSALRLWRTIGDRYQEAETLVRLADSYDSAGEAAAAAESRRDAERLFTTIGLSPQTQQRLKLAK